MEIDVDLHMVPIAEANQRYISSVGTADKLCDKIGPTGESLIKAILDELSKLDLH